MDTTGHKGHNLLARPDVGPAHDGYSLDFGEFKDRFLYLRRVHVEPVDDDQLARPVDQEQLAFGEVTDIAGAKPPLGIGATLPLRPIA